MSEVVVSVQLAECIEAWLRQQMSDDDPLITLLADLASEIRVQLSRATEIYQKDPIKVEYLSRVLRKMVTWTAVKPSSRDVLGCIFGSYAECACYSLQGSWQLMGQSGDSNLDWALSTRESRTPVLVAGCELDQDVFQHGLLLEFTKAIKQRSMWSHDQLGSCTMMGVVCTVSSVRLFRAQLLWDTIKGCWVPNARPTKEIKLPLRSEGFCNQALLVMKQLLESFENLQQIGNLWDSKPIVRSENKPIDDIEELPDQRLPRPVISRGVLRSLQGVFGCGDIITERRHGNRHVVTFDKLNVREDGARTRQVVTVKCGVPSREVQVLLQLKHKHVLPLAGHCQIEPNTYALVHDALISSNPGVSELHNAREFLTAALDALNYVHSCLILHCNVHPGAIMFSAGVGRWYLTDFVEAKPIHSLDATATADPALVLTRFQSSEVHSRGFSVETDLYSVGAAVCFKYGLGQGRNTASKPTGQWQTIDAVAKGLVAGTTSAFDAIAQLKASIGASTSPLANEAALSPLVCDSRSLAAPPRPAQNAPSKQRPQNAPSKQRPQKGEGHYVRLHVLREKILLKTANLPNGLKPPSPKRGRTRSSSAPPVPAPDSLRQPVMTRPQRKFSLATPSGTGSMMSLI